MNLTLFDVNKDMCIAWENEFGQYKNIKVLHTDLENLPPHEYLVTAGNSYGIMNGGIDLAMRYKFGISIQDQIQWKAVRKYNGCIPIGASITVDTGCKKFPFIIYAPTMIYPMAIPSSNVYLAMSSVLREHTTADSIACCGLGSLTGALPVAVVARAMREAYENVVCQ